MEGVCHLGNHTIDAWRECMAYAAVQDLCLKFPIAHFWGFYIDRSFLKSVILVETWDSLAQLTMQSIIFHYFCSGNGSSKMTVQAHEMQKHCKAGTFQTNAELGSSCTPMVSRQNSCPCGRPIHLECSGHCQASKVTQSTCLIFSL